MDNRKNKILFPLLLVLLAIVTVLACLFIHFGNVRKAAINSAYDGDETVTEKGQHSEKDYGAESSDLIKEENDATPEAETEEFDYVSALHDAMEKNPDVYAWISITDTVISYPVCNRPHNNKYYLSHSSDARWNPMGAIFSEDYNSRDFTDPCVVLYGHSMTGTKFFGTLQKSFSDRSFFDEHREIKVYLPDKILTYKTFGAISYSNVHILHYYDFTMRSYYDWFIESLYNIRSIDAILDEEILPSFENGDKILVLSTCLKGHNDKRFLVLSVLDGIEEILSE